MTGKDATHKHAEHHPRGKHQAAHHPAPRTVREAAHRASELVAMLGPGRREWGRIRRGLVRFARRPRVRQVFWGGTLGFAIIVVAMVGLWWRLSLGPIEVPMVTPWLKAAIEDNFGGKRTVSVGGTQIERDEQGRTSLRITGIVVRDADGTVVASAPKAEVGLSGLSLLTGKIRARSLNLVGAELAVRIESDGNITVFAGADKRPLATATAPAGVQAPNEPAPLRAGFSDLAGALAWIDGLGATGLDGYDLRELGLKDGYLTVDDKRNGKHWSFSHINVSLTRPRQGGVVFRITSENPEQRWDLSAAMRPLNGGMRALGIEARQVSLRDLLLALRLDRNDIDIELPLSASVRAEVAADGTPHVVQGRIVAGAGNFVDRANEYVHFKIDRAEVRFNWDAQHHVLVMPFQVQSGGNQFTMRAMLEAPKEQSGVWLVNLGRDDPVIDPVIFAGGSSEEEAFALNRAVARLRFDTVRKRIDLDQGDFSRVDTRPLQNFGLAVTGSLDYSGEPHLAFGVAGTRMPFAVMKRIWPIFTAADVRQWVEQHVSGGVVEHVVVAGNAPLADFQTNGPPTPEEGLSVEMETSGTTLQPVPTLPPIRDADLTVRVTGRTANISVGRGTVVVSPGRKLSVTGGMFEIPDTHLKPAPAHSTFRVDGTVPAAAELLASDALRDNAGLALDPATSRGTVTAQVDVNLLVGKGVPKNSAAYTISADLTNFSADKLLVGQKIEASSLHVNASRAGYEATGDVKINGMAGKLDFRQQTGQVQGDLTLQANLDEAARARLGLHLGTAVIGAIPMTITGKVGGPGEDKLNVEADFTPAKIDDLLPGWVKPAGKPAHATYTLVRSAKATRFDDLTIQGSGANVKGSVEFDAANDISSANFPVFGFSEGDKVTLKADRSSDGTLHVVMRGDIFDGGNFVKSILAGGETEKSRRKPVDLDLDVKLGTVIGRNGETLRGLDLKLGRHNGRIRNFLMSAKIGADSPFNGDMRLRARDGHQVIYFETEDAGALFRFTDMYPRMQGGRMWVAFDPPSQDPAPQQGTLFIRNFVVRGEPGLERVVGNAPNQPRGGVQFTELSCNFTKIPSRMAVHDGVVRGPAVGATIEGQIDYARNDVHLQGTFVPFYGLNNIFGQLPIVGPFLGGSKEGLLGITYDAVGPPDAPRITVNPVSAIAPGLLRKFFPSPGSLDRNFIQPTR